MKSITNGSDCGKVKGDLLSWDPLDWTYDEDLVRFFDIEQEDLCFNPEEILIKLSPAITHQVGMETCKILNGSLPRVDTEEAVNAFFKQARWTDLTLDLIKNSSSIFYENTLLPYKYIGGPENNTFLDYYSKEEFTPEKIRLWDFAWKNVGSSVVQMKKDVYGIGAHWYTLTSHEATCVFKQEPRFRIKGICKETALLWEFPRKHFILVNKYPDGAYRNMYGPGGILVEYVYEHEGQYKIIYNRDTNSWELLEDLKDGRGHAELIASIKGTIHRMALGTNVWTVYNESKNCKEEGEDHLKIRISLSICTDEHFTCDNGQCVAMEMR